MCVPEEETYNSLSNQAVTIMSLLWVPLLSSQDKAQHHDTAKYSCATELQIKTETNLQSFFSVLRFTTFYNHQATSKEDKTFSLSCTQADHLTDWTQLCLFSLFRIARGTKPVSQNKQHPDWTADLTFKPSAVHTHSFAVLSGRLTSDSDLCSAT